MLTKEKVLHLYQQNLGASMNLWPLINMNWKDSKSVQGRCNLEEDAESAVKQPSCILCITQKFCNSHIEQISNIWCALTNISNHQFLYVHKDISSISLLLLILWVEEWRTELKRPIPSATEPLNRHPTNAPPKCSPRKSAAKRMECAQRGSTGLPHGPGSAEENGRRPRCPTLMSVGQQRWSGRWCRRPSLASMRRQRRAATGGRRHVLASLRRGGADGDDWVLCSRPSNSRRGADNGDVDPRSRPWGSSQQRRSGGRWRRSALASMGQEEERRRVVREREDYGIEIPYPINWGRRRSVCWQNI